MYEIITSSTNKFIKRAKSLHKKRERWQQKCFFIEGIRSVRESILSNAQIEYLLYSDSLFNVKGGECLLNLIRDKRIKAYRTTDKIISEISDTQTPQGIFAVVKFSLSTIEDILQEEGNFLVILDRVQDPGNMGTIIRSAEALGATGIITTDGSVDIFNPKTIRATMGSIFHVPIIYTKNLDEVLIVLKKKAINIMSTSLKGADYCYNVDFRNDFALIIGNEANGISEDIAKHSTHLIKIPMVGNAESLNAAMASGIVMYEAMRQRQNF